MSLGTFIHVLPGSVVDTEALLDSVIASLVAGVFVTVTASVAIFGFATAAEMQRNGRDLAAIGAGVLAAVATLAFAGAIVLGIAVMIHG
jgi:hypothetical protein